MEEGDIPSASVKRSSKADLSTGLNFKKEKRKFNAKLFGRTIQKGFIKLHKDESLSDLTLIVGEEKIPVHRMVLCAWSETFRAMLDKGSAWAEASEKELEVNLDDEQECEHFKQILEYMYTGSTDFIDSKNVVPLIALSNYYAIDALKEVCGQLLGDNLSEDNVFYMLDIVEKYNCTELAKICGSFLASTFSDMWEEDRDRLLALHPDTWAGMLSNNELSIGSEQELYDCVMKYAAQFRGDQPKKDEVLTLLLPCVRFNFLPVEFLVETIEQDKSIRRLPVVEHLLSETYRYIACPGHNATVPSYNTEPRIGFQKWDSGAKGPTIVLSNECMTAQSSSGSWETVRALVPITSGHPYFQFKVDQSANMMLGVCVGTIAFTGYAGQYANGWTLHGAGGQFYTSGGNTAQNMSFTNGDIIGIFVDLENGQLIYWKNGVKGFTISSLPKNSGQVYPVASFAGANKVTLMCHAPLPKDAPTVKRLPKDQKSSAGKKKRNRKHKTKGDSTKSSKPFSFMKPRNKK